MISTDVSLPKTEPACKRTRSVGVDITQVLGQLSHGGAVLVGGLNPDGGGAVELVLGASQRIARDMGGNRDDGIKEQADYLPVGFLVDPELECDRVADRYPGVVGQLLVEHDHVCVAGLQPTPGHHLGAVQVCRQRHAKHGHPLVVVGFGRARQADVGALQGPHLDGLDAGLG